MAGKFANLNFTVHIDRNTYDALYAELKRKYGKSLIENWKECTDPHKYVYEDLGIAAYLCLLWKDQAPCTFVDLGCGNGLLVYILTQEGHRGRGLDVRKRKIWDTFPESTKLIEETIIPSCDSVYPDADWLIGNHSDELTVWLPIMAARSNATCQFFTIPCCPYKLNGEKYQRRKTTLSVYQDFLEYIQEVGDQCGFHMTAEKMKIPSTKRICLIGRRKMESAEESITNLIQKECPEGTNETTNWIKDFKPREAIQPVRNCSQIAKDVQYSILHSVQSILLSSKLPTKSETGKVWNQGGQATISELAERLPRETLEKLRSECKGLQTLLKNHHQIFSVKSGSVELRSPESLRMNSEKVRLRKDFKWKQKSCWFHDNHPDGCPLLESHCSYFHENKSKV